MKQVKYFESEDERISFQVVTLTIDGVVQEKELLIVIESPYTKKKDIVMRFDQDDALEIINEMLYVVNNIRKIKVHY